MSKLSNLFIFTVGAAIGSATTYKLLKTKYEIIAQEEIESVKEVYSKRGNYELKNRDTNEDVDISEKVQQEYTEIVDKNYRVVETEQTEIDINDDSVSYVITPTDFDEAGYRTLNYTYYADDVLTDENDIPIENVDEVVGPGSLNTFGEYEDDSVFVRNDALKVDIEILKDYRKYSDLPRREEDPHKMED